MLRNVQVSVCEHYHIDCVRHELNEDFLGTVIVSSGIKKLKCGNQF